MYKADCAAHRGAIPICNPEHEALHSLSFRAGIKNAYAKAWGNFVNQRKNDRFDFHGKAIWDFFAQKEGQKSGLILNVSSSGCLMSTSYEIDLRRWLRVLIREESSQLCLVIVGRVVRRDLAPLQFQYGIEFTFPNYFSDASTEVIFALSKRNLTVNSCRSLNSRSPIRPGFLA